jgi:cation transport regulator ChaB
MPCVRETKSPKAARDNLPKHAEASYRVVWSAVKESCEKQDHRWVKKD